nr:uncharacterized protein LOC125418679 [Ziziphus jujuba var. spinosa]
MDLNKIIVSLVTILLGLLQLKHQTNNLSAFDTHPTTMIIFCAVFVMYGVLLIGDELLPPTQYANYAGFRRNIRLCSGSLALILLLLVLAPVLGWFIFGLWLVCLLTALSEYLTLHYLLLRLHIFRRLLHVLRRRGVNREPIPLPL